MLDPNRDWGAWLQQCGQPVLFALGGSWRHPNGRALASIRNDLLGLGAVVAVVGAGKERSCLGPDHVPDLVPQLDRLGLATLHDVLGVDPGDPTGSALTLTLADQHGTARMQTIWSSDDDPAHVIGEVLGWAARSLVESATHWSPGQTSWHSFSRRELVVLSLIGAMALPYAVGWEPHASKAPRSRQLEA